jgi:hypothetical protein
MTIIEAKMLLRAEGYAVATLWHISDVQNQHQTTDEEAMAILDEVLGSFRVFSETFGMIYNEAERMNLKKKDL